MAIQVLELHHHAIRVPGSPDKIANTLAFYKDVFGLETDPARPEIPNLPGYWLNVGPVGQIHIMAHDGTWEGAKAADKDPTVAHVALAVQDIEAALAELQRSGIAHWTEGVVGNRQVFLKDPSGNLIELHQVDQCRCAARQRVPA
jgi:catechol 2,3-dioxygenase-like lactoylglutathione lyase family enzyme